MPKKRVVIIGAGLAGLSSAALLAKQGLAVTIVEKNQTIGGRARVLKKQGFVFDMGPSWYLMPEIMDQLFQTLGYQSSDFFKLKALTTKYKIFSKQEKTLTLSDNQEKNFAQFEQISPGSSQRIKQLIKKTSAAYDLAVNKLLTKPYHSLLDFLNIKDIKNGLALLKLFNPFQSYHRFIKKYVNDPDLQKIFEFHTVFLGGNPFDTPAIYSMLIAADFKQKIWYPMGGIGELIKALEKICHKLNVQIMTDTEITKLNIDPKSAKITSLESQNQKIKAELIINTMDYAYFDQNILPQKYQEYSKQYWHKQDYSISSILLYLGIDKKIPTLAHHNFYFQKDWRKHFDTLKNSKQLPKEPCFYLCAPSVSDPSVAPKGKENLFVLVPTSVNTQEANLNTYVDHLLNHIENITQTKFKDKICFQQVYSKKDFAQDYLAYKGNALGLAHTLKQSVFMRPRMKSKHVNNLYYAGQFTQPGVGMPMVILSALYINDLVKHAAI